MNIPITVRVSNTNPEECGDDCPFLECGQCLLFNADLDDQPRAEWRDGRDSAKLRCRVCANL
jgi:hypothetical protein